ncbi:MAG TPA: ribose-phosphate diphosphokinase, partial [Spirochaetia bacterium]|nr:ribose-phosphate diphosphokinase [Spirochaetia bacterium]
MSYTDPLRIGVLACPGGQVFADEIVTFLRKISPGGSNQTAPHVGEKPGGENSSEKAGDFKIEALFTRFSNGEFKTEILDSVRGMDVFIIQDVSNQYSVPYNNVQEKYFLSINDHIFCLLVTVDAALQAGARRVTVVLPTYPYARQHRKRTREGLTAARFGQIMENMGVERIITLDIHSKEIENTFNHLRLENLHASYQIIRVLKSIIDLRDPNLVIVSPDTGAIDRNKFYSQTLLKPLALLYKERDYSKLSYDAGNSNITNTRLLGPVEGKIVFMGDDMLGTGGTLLHAMKAIQKLGSAKTISSVSLPF